MPTIKLIKEKKSIEVPAGANLRKAALAEGVELYPGIHKLLNCHGLAMCGKCAVLVKKGMENCSEMSLPEMARLKTSFVYIGHESEMRLACQTEVNGDIEIETQPEMNWHGDRFWG
jgi:ferredoxin